MKLSVGATCLAVTLVTTSICSALPPNKEHKDRIHDVKLSDKQHELNEEHNNDYDHDAFLGEDEANEFDELSPDESKNRLGMIVDKIDKDKDGLVTEEELQHWIQYVQKKYVMEDTDRMWKDHDLEDSKLTWDSYRHKTYGYKEDPADDEDYSAMVKRDQRKFETADLDKDGRLSKEEFSSFLHPEEAEHMKDIVVLETIEDIDKDHDGYISLEEYIADIYDEDDDDDDDDDKEHMPEWVNSETEQFKSFRDRNHDGKLDKDEVREWVIPDDYDNSHMESRHLINTCDVDKDGKLTKEEILDKYDIFVGSQATDFGEALNRHDEF